jgi:flagellum-specific ATP synthase
MEMANRSPVAIGPTAPQGLTSGPLGRLARLLDQGGRPLPLSRIGGHVSEVAASHIRIGGLARQASLGGMVEIDVGEQSFLGEVIAIAPGNVTVKLFDAAPRVGLGASAWIRDDLVLRPDASWLGRIVNALGEPIDGAGALAGGPKAYAIDREPLPPLSLDRVRQACPTGIKAIDLFTPLCMGQRIGIFAGSGVGKSTLVGMLTRGACFERIVVALVAERAREVRDFLDDVLGPSRARAVLVVATSAESAMMRKLSAKTAMTIAEHFRDQGEHVLLVMDSITRFAHALREVALAAGEAPIARGYPPSVFAELPRLLERAGPGVPASGSITGVFSVLVDGDDPNEPLADAVRGILDGHIVLDRAIADQGRFPAIDPLTSISRLAQHAWTAEEAVLVRRLRALIARYEETRELRALGAYKPGVEPELDQAVAIAPLVYRFVAQAPGEPLSAKVFDDLAAALAELRAKEASPEAAKRPPPRSVSSAAANDDTARTARTAGARAQPRR